ncbi:hypothetical protein HDE_04387 [Halotydeus destructor]|nr:hypothetical protein HDE_04387 [Halotydeus destructor]
MAQLMLYCEAKHLRTGETHIVTTDGTLVTSLGAYMKSEESTKHGPDQDWVIEQPPYVILDRLNASGYKTSSFCVDGQSGRGLIYFQWTLEPVFRG